jgi:pyruvate dehydrogenase E1 component
MPSTSSAPKDWKTLNNIVNRAHYLANQMIYLANHRADKAKGDPKVGGHSSASSSSIHVLGAIHLLLKTGFDHIANKPHASPADHSYNYLLDLFLHKDLSRMSLQDCNQAMRGLRAFSQNGEPVFQSYHSAHDPDWHNFFPSGTVGIPPVNAGYMALAYSYARKHGYEVPDAHFWCLLGDSEFREGSLFEAIPDFAEREIGHLTWIVDYNRQSLDGHRITNPEIMSGTDATRIRATMEANGWKVFEARHGQLRLKLFERAGGQEFRTWIENELPDYELQALLNVRDPKRLKEFLADTHGKQIKNFSKFAGALTDQEAFDLFRDFGGHDLEGVYNVLKQAKAHTKQPTLIIAHTLKGWGLKMAAVAGNHSMLPDQAEIDSLREAQSIGNELFERFSENTKEGHFLKTRGEQLYREITSQYALKEKNLGLFREKTESLGSVPESLNVNFKMANYPHTQWMLGQLTAKMTRIANTPLQGAEDKKLKPLDDFERSWKIPSELLVSMAPDVGTSTNLNPAMDGKIFGAEVTGDIEAELEVKDKGSPDLVPGQEATDRFIRFEIAEANTMSCKGSFGRMRDLLGIPLLPLMTVYDFFIKRAHDQYFYNLYWNSSFILVGTPSGVTLSPEGAQHGWKSDFQIPNQITWEPFFCQELDWIFADAVARHMNGDNAGRTGVLIRGVTRGIEQKDFLRLLKGQPRFSNGGAGADAAGGASVDEAEILASIRRDVLAGAYYLIDYRGREGYEPGDNVVNIFAMGSLTTEAMAASEALLAKGIYANVIVVTSSDLLVGNLGAANDFEHLRQGLGVNADLHLAPSERDGTLSEAVRAFAGRRVPAVSVHDGEPGLLDNIGSIVGVPQEALAVRKHSKCGRPIDVYGYHGIDRESVAEACVRVLARSASEEVHLSPSALARLQGAAGGSSGGSGGAGDSGGGSGGGPRTDWRSLM